MCNASTTLCTHKSFHRQTNFSNTGSERILIVENLGNVQTNKQMPSSLETPFSHSSATLNKIANMLTFSGSRKSDMYHVSWRSCIQVCVVTYLTRRTLAHRTEIKAYWHFRHSTDDQEVKKAAGKMSCIITLVSQKIPL